MTIIRQKRIFLHTLYFHFRLVITGVMPEATSNALLLERYDKN